MTAADRAAQLRKQRAAPEPQPEPATRPEPPAKVRQTVDLTGEAHDDFARWRLTTALALGRTRLTTQDALAALVAVLLADEHVQRRVQAHLERQ